MRKIIFLLFLLLVFLSGCFSQDRYVYNGFTVFKHSLGWGVNIYVGELGRPHIINLHYGPRELEDIVVESGVRNVILSAKKIYVSFDPEMSNRVVVGAMDIVKVTGTHPVWGIFKITTQAALTKSDGENIVKTCKDAKEGDVVIVFESANDTKIYYDEDCVILQAKNDSDLVRVSDRLVYILLGVME